MRSRLLWRLAAFIGTLAIIVLFAVAANASCSTMQALAQEAANSMARRGVMDHAGFYARARRGARAENVAIASSYEQAMRLWRNSPPHAANMRLPGCKGVAHQGRYWAMEIGL